MRLICPNCGAQYEVDASVIPDSGRDVQCSNCGHTWFQKPPHLDADLAAELGHELRVGAGETASASPGPRPDPAAARPERPERRAESAEAPARRRLDPNVANVLREEAAREAAARRGDGGRDAIESQPDLGLEGPQGPRRVRPSGASAETLEDTAEPAPERGPRKGLLPDVEEINSTLRASDAPGRGEEQAPAVTAPPSAAERRRNARPWFWLVVLLAVAAALVYAFAPQLAEQAPGMEEPLTRYVEAVNLLRDRVDAAITGALARIGEMVGDAAG